MVTTRQFWAGLIVNKLGKTTWTWSLQTICVSVVVIRCPVLSLMRCISCFSVDGASKGCKHMKARACCINRNPSESQVNHQRDHVFNCVFTCLEKIATEETPLQWRVAHPPQESDAWP